MKFILFEEQWKMIITHLEKSYPEEGCGLLLGVFNEDYWVKKVYPMRNVWENPLERSTRYALSPKEWLKVEREAEENNLNILGIYHSHPNYPAYPSSFDLESAWEGYVYLIVEIREGKVYKARAFLINSVKAVKEVPIEIREEV